MISKLKKLFTLSISLFLAFSSMILSVQSVKASFFGESQISDTTSCSSDLTQTLKNFWSINDLTSLDDDIRFVSFVETNFGIDNFGLYVYVFNANKLDLDNSVDNIKNNVQFGFSYSEEDLFSVDYNKYNISFLDSFDQFNGTFLKYKVTNFTLPESSVPNPTRYYAISGIELLTVGESNANEYPVGSIFKCSGSEVETIISKSPLDTIEIKPHHTFYRTNFSEKNKLSNGLYGTGWANQISSCYFSLPTNFTVNGKGSSLTSLTAEFDYVYSKPIVILNNSKVFNALNENLHETISLSKDTSFNADYYYKYNSGDYFFCSSPDIFTFGSHSDFYYEFGYLIEDFTNIIGTESQSHFYDYTFDRLIWLILKENAVFDKNFILSSDEIKEKYEELNTYYYSSLDYLDSPLEDVFYISDNNLSLCGFYGGYNKHTYSISSIPEENADVLGYKVKFDDSNFWELFWNNNKSSTEEFPPLVKVNKNDVGLSDEDLSKKYYIDKSEILNFRTYLFQQNQLGKDVWILRYDVCEYFGKTGRVFNHNGSSVADCLISQEAFYLGFDILQLGLAQDGKVVSLAVNHSPEDIFPPITPAPIPEIKTPGCSDYASVLSILAGLGLGVVIYILVTKVINFIKKE